MIYRSIVVLLFVAFVCIPVAVTSGFGPQQTDQSLPSTEQAADGGALSEATAAAGEATGQISSKQEIENSEPEFVPLISNDAVIFGILMIMLGLIFWSSSSSNPVCKRFYKFVPMLLLCYFLPSLLTFFGIVDHHESSLYTVATRYLLPATLVLLTLSIDMKEILRLGPKALIMFLTGTIGVVLGGPIAVLIVMYVAPDIIGVDGPDAVWRGLSTVAGSWIGGGANQASMQVIFMTPPTDATPEVRKNLTDLYSVMVAVDVFVAEIWMFFLLLGVGKAKEKIDYSKRIRQAFSGCKIKWSHSANESLVFQRQRI